MCGHLNVVSSSAVHDLTVPGTTEQPHGTRQSIHERRFAAEVFRLRRDFDLLESEAVIHAATLAPSTD